MALPGGVLNYRYGPGASYREGLEHNLIETIFEDRTALEAVMKDFIGSHGKIAGLITSTLRLFQRDVHTIHGKVESPGFSAWTIVPVHRVAARRPLF